MPRPAPPLPLSERVARLRYTPLFSELPIRDLRRLAEACATVEADPGEVIVTQGGEGDALYVVVRGLLRAERVDRSGHHQVLQDIHKGEFFGEFALLDHVPRSASVVVRSDATLMTLSRGDFEAVSRRHPEIVGGMRAYLEHRKSQHVEEAGGEQGEVLRRVSVILDNASSGDPGESNPGVGSGATDAPTLHEIEVVILDPDPVRRNYGITRLYYRIGVALGRLLGDEDVNWPLFGARASYTAGFAIRKEDLQLTEVAGGGPWLRIRAWFVGRLIRNSVVERHVDAILSTVSDAIAAGNLRIFAEIGTVLGRFVTVLGRDRAYDEAHLASFLDTLVDGPVEVGGQDLLKRALTCWYEAAFEEDRDAKAEKLFLGNCLIGLHEQTRVQPEIDEALEAPLRLTMGYEPGRWLLNRPALRWLPMRQVLQRVTDGIGHAFMRRLAHMLRQGTTRLMMRLRLPHGDLWLGKPVRSSITTPLSEELATLDLPEVRSFVEPHGRGRPRGATDWASLPERMRYIVGLFRAVQKDRTLWEAPPEPHGSGVERLGDRGATSPGS